MPRIVIDFETRSTINLKKCGAYVYAAHPDTEILMLGYKIDDGLAHIWWPAVKPIEYTFPFPVWSDGRKVVAHNAEFEMCMWREIMHKRLGYPDIPLQNWDDTAARASMCALPRSLDGVCQALGLQHQKDDEGHRLMLQMCKPKPLTKKMRLELAVELGTQEDFIEQEGKFILSRLAADPEAPSYLRPDYRSFYRWKEDPASMQRLAEYCLKDVEAEYELDRVLPALPPKERRIWELDRKINDRGIKVDIPAVKNIIYTLKKHEEKLNGRLYQLTNGRVASAKSSAALADYLELPNVQKTTISDAVQSETDETKHAVLSIRQSLGQSSVAKFQSLISATDPRDSRIRGLLLYHGAGTGRWAGKLFQPQNLPKGDQDRFPSPNDIIEMFTLRDPEIIEVLYDDPVEAAVNCIRGMLISDDDLLVNDYSSIEGRGMPWAAGEQHVLQAYIDGKDMYKVAAQAIFHCGYDEVTPKQRKIGKVPELACQYAGADGAMLNFGADRLGLEKEEREKIVQQWREDRPATVSIWHMLSDAAEHATRYGTNSDLCAARERLRGQLWRQKYHWWNWLMQAEEWPQWKRIVFGINGPFLCMKLPSGRLIRYYAPKIEMVQTPWGKHREAVTAMRMVKVGTREVWMRDSLSGGTLANNLIQGLCRDIIADAMLRLDENGFPIVLTVHDEIVAEDQGARFPLFKQLMDEVPSWAEGFPIASNGFYAKRYKKD